MKRGEVKGIHAVVVFSLVAVAGILALVMPFLEPNSTGEYTYQQNIFVNEDNPCFMIGCRGYLKKEAVLVGIEGTKFVCACAEDILPDGTPRPGSEYYIEMVRKY